jgi:peptidoglycan/LPS O-acetylase OafA/YrhL
LGIERAKRAAEGESADIVPLTSLRGVAAVWVVLLHFLPVIERLLPEAGFLKPLAESGGFAVPLFFILSGYVIGLRYLAKLRSPTIASVRQFWWRRLARIYPVHLCMLLVCLAIVARHGWPKDDAHSVESFLANLFLVDSWGYDFRLSWNYPAWSISSEWFAYLIFPLAAVLIARWERRPVIAFTVACCALAIGAHTIGAGLPFHGLMVAVPTFLGGVGLARLLPPSARAVQSRILPDATVATIVMLPFAIEPGPFRIASYLMLFFVLVGAMGENGNRCTPIWRFKPLIYLGELSYSLYMTHVVCITLFVRFYPSGFDRVSDMPLPMRIAALAACTLILLAAALAMHYLVERPLRILARRTRIDRTDDAASTRLESPSAERFRRSKSAGMLRHD